MSLQVAWVYTALDKGVLLARLCALPSRLYSLTARSSEAAGRLTSAVQVLCHTSDGEADHVLQTCAL